jgi:hypothetical protein
MAVTF